MVGSHVPVKEMNVNDVYEINHIDAEMKSNEHMDLQLTCSQRQWLHSSVGRASHRYREVTGSNPVEVLNFVQAYLRNGINCIHNCEDHPSSEIHLFQTKTPLRSLK